MKSQYEYEKYKSKYLNTKQNQYGGYQNKTYKLDNETAIFINSIKKSPPIYALQINEARQVLNNVAIPTINDNLAVNIEDIIIPNNISIRIIKPLNSDNKLPFIMYFHGGGWVLGNKNTHNRLIKELVVNANVAIVFVNYTLAP